MKLTYYVLSTFFALTLFAACQSSGGEKEGMAKFAEDTAFQAAHASPDSLAFQGKGEMIGFATPDGKRGSAYSLKSATDSKKYLFVIHEWWGLNDHIKKEAERLYDELGDVNVMALDIYDGKSTADPEEAGKIMGEVQEDRAVAIIKGALAMAGQDAKVATVGWCFGGGWSLRSSILAGDRGAGCVMYYGLPVEKADQLAPLKADVLGLFAKKDGWINEPVVQGFENLAKATGKKLEVHWYDADHAFANPSNPNYDQEAAGEANALALAFLKEHLN